jgi:hypothetical protein
MDFEDEDFTDSKNLKFKLQHLEPLKPLNIEGLKTSGVKSLKSESLKDLTTPINVFGGSDNNIIKEEVVKESINSSSSKFNKSPRSFYGSVSGRINPLHYKTRDMCKDYNSLMNSLYPRTEGSKGLEESESLKALEYSTCKVQELSEDDPSKICNQNPSKIFDSSSEFTGISENNESLKHGMFFQELEMKHDIESKILDSLEPKAKDYELEESIIETLPYSKKKCIVWWEGETLPYSKFRENPEHIIFFVGEDAYGYSKKCLYEEYIKSQHATKSRDELSCRYNTSSRVYFDLDLNWEDGEILWVPMSQILRILEFSHPVYELQKTKFSNKVWNTIPVKLIK